MATPASTASTAQTVSAGQASQQLAEVAPSPLVLVHAAKLAMSQDKPIQLDYYTDSTIKKTFIGEDGETKEKMLVKSNDEFTSLIQKVYKVSDKGQEDFIIMTENSIYLVSGKVEKRKINAAALRGM